MSKKKPLLPEYVYIIREEDGDDSFLVASETYAGIDPGVLVGRYELVKTGKVEKQETFVSND